MNYAIDGWNIAVLDAHGAVIVHVDAIGLVIYVAYCQLTVSKVSQLQLTVILGREGRCLVAAVVASVDDTAVSNDLSDGVAYCFFFEAVP